MTAVISLLLVLTLSILITRIATVALTYTGLSRESARFQARSAFTGVGFTTGESENVVNHPVRRRVVLLLMLLGNAGIITAVTSLILTFITPGSQGSTILRLGMILGGVVVLWLLASSKVVDRYLERFIHRLLRRYTQLDVTDYATLLRISGKYSINEILVQEEDWMADKKLAESRLREEGVLVIAVVRKSGRFVGVPDGETHIDAGDTLIVYGRDEALKELDERQAGYFGDREHEEARQEQEVVEETEKEEDKQKRERERKLEEAKKEAEARGAEKNERDSLESKQH
jgi:NhaP-type Na+/H+ and K+/H+ antiporter